MEMSTEKYIEALLLALEDDGVRYGAEIEQLRAEAANVQMSYRTKCDAETKAQAVKIEQLAAALDELIAVKDLRRQVREAFFNGNVDLGCKLDDDYDRRDPLAWAEARKLREKT
jgi:hypothetical protein